MKLLPFRPVRVMISAALCLAAPLTARAQTGAGLDHSSTLIEVAAGVAIGLVVFLILRKLAKPSLPMKVNGPQPAGVPSGLPSARVKDRFAEDEDFADFIMEFRAGPLATPRVALPGIEPVLAKIPAPAADKTGEPGGDKLQEVFAWAPGQVEAARKLIEKSARETAPRAQHDILAEVAEKISGLKQKAGVPELRPAWELATAIEGLLKQLTSRVNNITPSTLRTLAASVDLLGELYAPGVPADLAEKPAIRILVVDDDAVSRFTVCAALRRALDPPEVAENGEAALALAREHHYDLIILDVMMPGMDGFEVCTKIRETSANAATPVLFVTALKDFDARARSLAIGANDLMGKPFLAFEVTLKALTLALRSRLHARPRTSGVAGGLAAPAPAAVAWPALPPEAAPDQKQPPPMSPQPAAALSRKQSGGTATKSVADTLPPPIFAENGSGPRQFSPAFLEYITAATNEMIDHVSLIDPMEEGRERWEAVARLHLRLSCLGRRIDVPELRPALVLCQTLEGLFKKFQENPKNATQSALRTAAAGFQLFKELCGPGVKPDLADKPPIRILVVDDEPLARRAITGALQMAFARPDGAESGENAVILAEEREYDLVFMDVCMPVMDGFAACKRIHESARNRSTPVVFVTSHSDDAFRAQAARCGAWDYVVKPFVFMEITVKAMTFALRGRLENAKKPASQAGQPQPTPA